MILVVSDSTYTALYNLYGASNPDAFQGSNQIDMIVLLDAGIYEIGDEGFYNVYLNPSQDGYFIPNNEF